MIEQSRKISIWCRNSLFLKFFKIFLLIKNSIERFTTFSEEKKYDSFLEDEPVPTNHPNLRQTRS